MIILSYPPNFTIQVTPITKYIKFFKAFSSIPADFNRRDIRTNLLPCYYLFRLNRSFLHL